MEDPDERFFVKAFMKGFKNGGFSELLSIWKPCTIYEVRARANKHIEVEETTIDKDERDAKGPKRREN